MNSQANPRSAWARRLTTALAMVGLLGAAAAMGGGCVDTTDSTKAEAVCGNGFAKCGDACVDTTLDVANCGACGTACAAGELCSAGVCGLDCLGGTTKCDATCVDTMLDVANCGACGTKCAAGEVCSKGACALECNGGTTKCDATCVDTKLDIANCGGCGTKCAAGEVCSDGACGTSCAGGSTLCDSACVTTESDPSNCGGCGTMCAAASNAAGVCIAGSCGYACSAGFADCDASGSNGCEIDTKTDANNCGACGNACHFDNASAKCTTGACALDTCNAGFGDCDSNTVNGCEVDTKSDLANCGSCGTTCAQGEVCLSGLCKTPNVLILGAANNDWNAEVKAKLDGTAAFTAVDLYPVASQTPTLADLQGYYAVLVYADFGFADGTALGNVLASYWDGGGKVVIFYFANAYGYLGGAFADLGQGYMVLDPNGSGSSDTCSGQITFDEPASPLVKDVVSLTAGSAYRNNGAPVNGGIVVARWSDGTPLVVRGTKNGRDLVELNFYPPSVDSRGDFWPGSGTELMRNALLF